MKWSIEEEKFLEENYKLISDEEIAKYLGRTLSSVRRKVNFEKAKRHKQDRLTKKNNYLTEEQRKEKVKCILLLATGILLD